MPRAVVLQHISCESPGLFTGMLADRGIAIDTVELDQGHCLPDWPDADLVIAMGGPMAAYDDAAHPWLAGEKRWIAAAVRAGMPYFGVCLGAQLLAASLGADVYAGDRPEVGVLPVEVTAHGRADPVFGVLGAGFAALQWHGDTFAIPAGAVRLAQSAAYPNQAFRFGQVAYAVQFHVEVTGSMLDQWRQVPAYRESARAVLGPGGLGRLAAAFAAESDSMAKSAAEMFAAWLEHASRGGKRAGAVPTAPPTEAAAPA
jgi:GMP synthase (glutamine-hydrolysing)